MCVCVKHEIVFFLNCSLGFLVDTHYKSLQAQGEWHKAINNYAMYNSVTELSHFYIRGMYEAASWKWRNHCLHTLPSLWSNFRQILFRGTRSAVLSFEKTVIFLEWWERMKGKVNRLMKYFSFRQFAPRCVARLMESRKWDSKCGPPSKFLSGVEEIGPISN